jgi:tRNA (mo5U34)-methyltransferase
LNTTNEVRTALPKPSSSEPCVFATRSARAEAEQCTRGLHFYHSFTLSNGLRIPGDYDMARSIDTYPFPSDMRGMRVLDIGPASGWFSFYFESRGATVTAVETCGYGDFDRYGFHEYCGPDRAPDLLRSGQPIWFGPMSASFWAIHDLIGSRVQWVNARAYEVSTLISEPFDLIFMGQLLLHLRDPIGALRAARSVCRGTCIATTFDWREHEAEPTPIQSMPWTHLDQISWWLPNKAALAHWMRGAGFRDVDVERRLTIYPDATTTDAAGRVLNEIAPSRIAVGFV